MSDKRRIRCDGEELGDFKLDKLMRMRTSEEIDHTTEFFALKRNSWQPIAGIIEDMEEIETTKEKVANMKEIGFKKVTFLGNDDDCPSCAAIVAKQHPIDSVPTIPPSDCVCNPWCRLSVIVVPD